MKPPTASAWWGRTSETASLARRAEAGRGQARPRCPRHPLPAAASSPTRSPSSAAASTPVSAGLLLMAGMRRETRDPLHPRRAPRRRRRTSAHGTRWLPLLESFTTGCYADRPVPSAGHSRPLGLGRRRGPNAATCEASTAFDQSRPRGENIAPAYLRLPGGLLYNARSPLLTFGQRSLTIAALLDR